MEARNQSTPPLLGKRIVITRGRPQAAVMRQALQELGAEVIEIPTIEIRDPRSWQPLDSAIERLEDFDFLLITSVNGVRKFLDRLHARGRDPSALRHLEVGAIGPATATELRMAGVRVDVIPSEYRAEGLLSALHGRDLRGKMFLIPRAKVARDLVPRTLRQRGAEVEVVEAYETSVAELSPAEFHRLLTPPPDLITFTSSSTASHFARLAGPDNVVDRLAGVAIASIGPVTSETIRRLGLAVTVEASESTVRGLVQAIVEYMAQQSDS